MSAFVIIHATGIVLGVRKQNRYEAAAYETTVAHAEPTIPKPGISAKFNAMLRTAPSVCLNNETQSLSSATIHLLNTAAMNTRGSAMTCT